MNRRELILGGLALSAARAADRPVRFGIITDVHHGLAPDAADRLAAFLDEVADRDLDFLIQLGDFCHPTAEARPFVSQLRRFRGPVRHVLGNHDMDRGSKADILALWGEPEPHYAFRVAGWRFVVLDLNHILADGRYLAYEQGNYFPHKLLNRAGPEQLGWLAEELKRSAEPTVVFAHQPIGATAPDGGLPAEQLEILDVLRGSSVVACLYGHLHVDRQDTHDGIHCVCLNSASYHWAGGMHPYADPLFAMAELRGDRLTIEGRWSRYAAADPREGPAATVLGANPWISNRRLALSRGG